MRVSKILFAGAVAGFAFIASLASTNATDASSPPDGVANASLASSMAEYGMAHKDPATLLAAARIMDGLKANVTKPMGTGGAKPELYDPMTLLKLAQSYATGADASLASAITGEMKNVSATQAVCYYQYYYYYGYLYYRYLCY